MNIAILVGLMLFVWVLSFLLKGRVPRSGRLFLTLLLALVSGFRFAQLIKGGEVVGLPTVVYAALAGVFLLASWRLYRSDVVKS